DEGEPPAAAGVPVRHHLGAGHLAVLAEGGQQVVRGGVERQVADVQLLAHDRPLRAGARGKGPPAGRPGGKDGAGYPRACPVRPHGRTARTPSFRPRYSHPSSSAVAVPHPPWSRQTDPQTDAGSASGFGSGPTEVSVTHPYVPNRVVRSAGVTSP